MDERLYCGDKAVLPAGYTGFGSRFRCLQKGVGVGLYAIRRVPSRRTWYRVVPWYVWVLGAVLFLLVIVLIILLLLR